MATIDNIIMMLEKGYSKDEIDNLLAQDETDVPKSSQEGANDSQEGANDSQEGANDSQEDANDSHEPVQVKEPPEDITALTGIVTELAKQVQTLTAATQLRNTKLAEQPEGHKEMSAEDYLLRTLHPEYRKEDV